MSTRIVVAEGVDAILGHAAGIDALAAEAGSFFHSTDWLRAWSRVSSPDAPTGILALEGDRVVGYLGTARLRRALHRRAPLPLRYHGLLGSGYGAADHLGPIGDPATFDALIDVAVERAGSSTMLLESVDPTHEARFAAHGFRTVNRKSCPRIDLRDVTEEGDLWPRKLLKEMRRRERRMAEEGITGRWVETPDELVEQLPSLQDTHLERWRSKGGGGLFDDERMALLHGLCTRPDARFRPMMYVLTSGGATVASLLLLSCGPSLASYKSGWRPELHALAPGVAVHAAAIRRAIEEGRDTYDFLRGTSGHKYTLRAQDRHDVSMIGGRGPTRRLLELRERG